MYIGLFLLIPFINIVIKKVYESENRHLLWALILTSLLLTSLPTMVSRQGHVVLSRYWEMNFPVTFYLLGAYIRMYQPQLPYKYMLVSFACLSINLIISILIGWGKLVNITGAYYGVVNMVAVYILFVLLYSIKEIPCRKMVTTISVCSLNMYLFSFVTDKMLYPIFIEHFYTMQSEFLIWFTPITCCLLAMDFVCAIVLQKIINLIYRNE